MVDTKNSIEVVYQKVCSLRLMPCVWKFRIESFGVESLFCYPKGSNQFGKKFTKNFWKELIGRGGGIVYRSKISDRKIWIGLRLKQTKNVCKFKKNDQSWQSLLKSFWSISICELLVINGFDNAVVATFARPHFMNAARAWAPRERPHDSSRPKMFWANRASRTRGLAYKRV